MSKYGIHPTLGKMTATVFLEVEGPNYAKKEIFPSCPCCKGKMYLRGVFSHDAPSLFAHFAANPGCPLSSSPDQRFAHLVPNDWDIERGEKIKREFCEIDNLCSAYKVARDLCEPLGGDAFYRMCREANRKNIWAYADIPLWAIPYILVTLDDIRVFKRDRKTPSYSYRFVLNKQTDTKIDAVWEPDTPCVLVRHFADSGKRMAKPAISIPSEDLEQSKTDIDWIKRNPGLLKKIQECCEDEH